MKRRLAKAKIAEKVLIVDGAIMNTALDSKPVFLDMVCKAPRETWNIIGNPSEWVCHGLLKYTDGM